MDPCQGKRGQEGTFHPPSGLEPTWTEGKKPFVLGTQLAHASTWPNSPLLPRLGRPGKCQFTEGTVPSPKASGGSGALAHPWACPNMSLLSLRADQSWACPLEPPVVSSCQKVLVTLSPSCQMHAEGIPWATWTSLRHCFPQSEQPGAHITPGNRTRRPLKPRF